MSLRAWLCWIGIFGVVSSGCRPVRSGLALDSRPRRPYYVVGEKILELATGASHPVNVAEFYSHYWVQDGRHLVLYDRFHKALSLRSLPESAVAWSVTTADYCDDVQLTTRHVLCSTSSETVAYRIPDGTVNWTQPARGRAFEMQRVYVFASKPGLSFVEPLTGLAVTNVVAQLAFADDTIALRTNESRDTICYLDSSADPDLMISCLNEFGKSLFRERVPVLARPLERVSDGPKHPPEVHFAVGRDHAMVAQRRYTEHAHLHVYSAKSGEVALKLRATGLSLIESDEGKLLGVLAQESTKDTTPLIPSTPPGLLSVYDSRGNRCLSNFGSGDLGHTAIWRDKMVLMTFGARGAGFSVTIASAPKVGALSRIIAQATAPDFIEGSPSTYKSTALMLDGDRALAVATDDKGSVFKLLDLAHDKVVLSERMPRAKEH